MVRYPLAIRIVKVPEGEAPEEVRRHWVGLVLPARNRGAAVESEILGGGLRSIRENFAVPTTIAVLLLRFQSEDAGDYFIRTYTGKELSFGKDEVEVLQ